MIGAAASALPSHGRGRRFDSCITHASFSTSSNFTFWHSLRLYSISLLAIPLLFIRLTRYPYNMREKSGLRLHRAMVAAFGGWNDACSSSTNVIQHLLNTYPNQEVGAISSEGFYDYQISRPTLCHVQGRRNIYWPETKFYELSIDSDLKILLETGPEPNYNWIQYCRKSVHFAEDYDVESVITLGSMFADCPHTRELPMDDLASDKEVDVDGHSGPIGIPTVLDSFAFQAGFETESIWVSVPQYLGSDECAQGTLQLLRKLSTLLGTTLDEGDLPQKAEHWQDQGTLLINSNDSLCEYVQRLERESDAKAASHLKYSFDEPVADELALEAEEYLKSIGRPSPSAE